MYHISANLAFGRREKNIWGYKKLQGGKKPIRKTVKNLWGRQKISRGAPNCNVTPLRLSRVNNLYSTSIPCLIIANLLI